MNISRLSSASANAQPVSARPFQSQPKLPGASERGVDGKPHATHSSHGRETGQVEGAPDHGHDHSQRVANFAAGIETRIQNAIENGNLSDEQVQALQQAASAFQSLMNRISNADFSHSPKRQVLFALHQLGDQIQNILHPEEQGQPASTSTLTRSSDVAAATAAPSIDALA
jgi:hypothetical protein